jgi:asparagine synthase (glutamine-hydrolysing)
VPVKTEAKRIGTPPSVTLKSHGKVCQSCRSLGSRCGEAHFGATSSNRVQPLCGIAGFRDDEPTRSRAELLSLVQRMTSTLAHRGPDGAGVWVEPEAGIALGHRRLSVIDLSPAGQQPMLSACSRYAITYNGEIYNFQELRRRLEAVGHGFRGHSDTEVLLAAISAWGIDAALRQANGMFALALWDRAARRLTLARDRAGKKPLYYARFGHTVMFGSELKALRSHPAFDPTIDRDALDFYLRFGWIPSPQSIHAGVRQVAPASYVTFNPGPDAGDPLVTAYWSAAEVAERGRREPFRGSPEAAAEAVEAVLGAAVRDRMVADVPLGALLSGGIDSSAVVALMQSMSSRPIKTFSIGYREPAYDEAGFAGAVARHLGTDHTSFYVSSRDATEVIPLLPALYDEPSADISQVPTYLVSRLARQHVTVALSGDGGDETFCGYSSYPRVLKKWAKLGRRPLAARRATAALMAAAGRAAWLVLGGERFKRAGWRSRVASLPRRAALLAVPSLIDLAWENRASLAPALSLVIGAEPARPAGGDRALAEAFPVQALQHLDFVSFLVDKVLVKVDRASMGVGLEVRCPFLDERVIELGWSLPSSLRIGPQGGKQAVRQMLYRHVPPALIDRPKRGFGAPVAAWLRGPLQDWAESLIGPARLRQDGVLDDRAVRRIWDQHRTRWRDHTGLLWAILMFQAWQDSLRIGEAGRDQAA